MNEAGDKNFDDFAHRFEKNIYETTKGKLRLKLVSEDLVAGVPGIDKGGLCILDAGCGMGYMAALLAGMAHHQFTLCDISSAMLTRARRRFDDLPQTEVTFHQTAIQRAHDTFKKPFDLVLVHAVLEWLGQPKAALEAVLSAVRPGGYVSLLFYNRYALIYRHLVMGNYRRLNDRQVDGFGGTLTPTNPLDPYEVEHWLAEQGMDIVRKTGIRTFFDYQTRETKRSRSFEDTYEMEHRFARQQPFIYLGRYIHLLCKKPE